MDEVYGLTIEPFRHIIDEAGTALQNAGTNDIMHKAATKLRREGERAIRIIKPQCTKRHAEYGDDFLNALRDDIKEPRTDLNRLVYGFYEFTEADQFDIDKYSELQALTREVALKIYEILISMKIEVKKSYPPIFTQFSPPSSPGPPPLYPIPPTPSRSSVQSQKWSPSNPHFGAQRKPFHGANCAPGDFQSFHNRCPSSVNSVLASECGSVICPIQPSSPSLRAPTLSSPSSNSWNTSVTESHDGSSAAIGVEAIPRRSLAVSPSPRPLSLGALTSVSPSQQRHSRTLQRPATDFSWGYFDENVKSLPFDEAEWRKVTDDHFSDSSNSSHLNPYPNPLHLCEKLVPLPNETICQNVEPTNTAARQINKPYHMRQASLGSGSLVHEPQRDTFGVYLQPSGADSVAESIVDPYLNNVHIAGSPQTDSPQESSTPVEHPDSPAIRNIDDGLIPVEANYQPSSLPRTRNLSRQDCTIGSSSSFYQRKGFCNGAKEIIAGGLGVRKTKRPVGLNGQETVARCTSCFFELSFKDIEKDLEKQDCGNLRHGSIGYRLRFLQKCHVYTKRPDDVLYACVFCIRSGRTLDPSDATVFFNLKSLFTHLARHPRPLPEVAGIVVIDEPKVPAQNHNDYDLHFLRPPIAHPVVKHDEFLSMMPVGVAKESVRKMYGKRLLDDGTPTLELVAGSRVTGLEFPSKYNGEWCTGWHDGVHAAVPLDKLNLQCPAVSDIKMDGTSHVTAKARWKFSHRDKGQTEWLKFYKDEVITNISWVYPGHWCWSGTNAKGKWGIFPQAFLDADTVQELSVEAAQPQRAVSLNTEKNKSLFHLSRFSVRKAQGRLSIGSSIASSRS